jgi:hypothetical protein
VFKRLQETPGHWRHWAGTHVQNLPQLDAMPPAIIPMHQLYGAAPHTTDNTSVYCEYFFVLRTDGQCRACSFCGRQKMTAARTRLVKVSDRQARQRCCNSVITPRC